MVTLSEISFLPLCLRPKRCLQKWWSKKNLKNTYLQQTLRIQHNYRKGFTSCWMKTVRSQSSAIGMGSATDRTLTIRQNLKLSKVQAGPSLNELFSTTAPLRKVKTQSQAFFMDVFLKPPFITFPLKIESSSMTSVEPFASIYLSKSVFSVNFSSNKGFSNSKKYPGLSLFSAK